jgi:hypothetical protein
MRKLFSKKTNNKNRNYILKDSIKVINKHISDFSISISGELAFNNPILYQRKNQQLNLDLF